jgi:hypothetical protein
MEHRNRSIELLLRIGTARDFKMDGSELMPVMAGLRRGGVAAHGKKHHSGQRDVSCEHLEMPQVSGTRVVLA